MKIEFNILQGDKPEARYGIFETPVGECLLADTAQGICWLSFVNGTKEEAVSELVEFWGYDKLKLDVAHVKKLGNSIFTNESSKNKSISVLVFGTQFQLKQWIALCGLSVGDTATYSELALISGFPRAIRAVGTAIGKNNVSFLIPCHRVIRSDGSIGNYRWGAEVKRKLLDWERGIADKK